MQPFTWAASGEQRRVSHPGFGGGSAARMIFLAEGRRPSMAAPKKYPDEVSERAVRLVA